MALRASAAATGNRVDPSAVTDPSRAADSGIACAAELLAFADAVVAGDDASAMTDVRNAVERALGGERLVDVAAVASNFQRTVRIADSTGIPIDAPMDILSTDLRADLGIDAYGSAANTPVPNALKRMIGVLVRPFAVQLMARLSKRMGSD